MTSKNEIAFYSHELDEVLQGDIRISAPTLNDIVQISASISDGRTQLLVNRTRKKINVQREDGQPLQVEINTTVDDPGSYYGIRQERLPVFANSANAIYFEKDLIEYDGTRWADGDNWEIELCKYYHELWVPGGDGVEITEKELIRRFASDLGVFVARKQMANYRFPRTRRALGRMSIKTN